MRVHHVRVDAGEVHVGATTEQRWAWELEDGRPTAVDATDIVWVTLTRRGPRVAIAEAIGLFPDRDAPERAAALRVIPALLDTAWRVIDEGWDQRDAIDALYGQDLGDERAP